MRPERRFAIHLAGVQPVLAVEREVEVADRPLLGLPAPVQVHVAGHLLDAAVDERKDVVDPDVAQLLEARAGDALEVWFQLLPLGLNRHGDAGPLDQSRDWWGGRAGRISPATEFSFVGASGLDGVVGLRDCEPRAASVTAQRSQTPTRRTLSPSLRKQ